MLNLLSIINVWQISILDEQFRLKQNEKEREMAGGRPGGGGKKKGEDKKYEYARGEGGEVTITTTNY